MFISLPQLMWTHSFHCLSWCEHVHFTASADVNMFIPLPQLMCLNGNPCRRWSSKNSRPRSKCSNPTGATPLPTSLCKTSPLPLSGLIQHTTNFIIFPRKQALTFHANCLAIGSCFLGKIFQYVVCWKFYPQCYALTKICSCKHLSGAKSPS